MKRNLMKMEKRRRKISIGKNHHQMRKKRMKKARKKEKRMRRMKRRLSLLSQRPQNLHPFLIPLDTQFMILSKRFRKK